MNNPGQDRYVSNEKFGGCKEHDGFVCSSITRKGAIRTNCVAVKMCRKSVQIRDTKDDKDTTLSFTMSEWKAFIKGVKKGEFNNT